MYRIIKMFSKDIFAAGEFVERFHFDATGKVFAVETNLSVYLLEKVS